MHMGNGSASQWVTIILGVLAVLGTVGGAWGGQWIAARRDDKRWKRELDREEIRWERERERERVQLERDIRSQWRSDRLDAYVDALRKFDFWSHSIVRENFRGETEGVLPCKEASDLVFEAAGRIQILGSETVVFETFETFNSFREAQQEYGDLPTRDERLNGGHRCTFLVNELRNIMRIDLGIDDAELLSSSSPSEKFS